MQRSNLLERIHFVRKRSYSLLIFVVISAMAIALIPGCHDGQQPATKAQTQPGQLDSSGNQAATGKRSPSDGPQAALNELALARKDPGVDGWTSEVWNEKAGEKLQQIGGWFSRPAELSAEDGDAVIHSAGVHSTALHPQEFELWSDGQLQIKSGQITTARTVHDPAQFIGKIQGFAEIFEGNRDVHVKFKIIRIIQTESSLQTVAYFQSDCHGQDSSLQINATWTCDWEIVGGDLLLRGLTVGDYEIVRSEADGDARLFADCTSCVFRNVDSFESQIKKSTNYWRRRIQAALGIDLFGHQGMAVGDANGDGLQDIYVCQPGGIVNRLYLQQADGTLLDGSTASGTDFLDRSRAAMFVDFDNDGDQDLAIVVDANVLFLSNSGSGQFSLRTSRFIGTSVTLAAADYDLDGDVDLYTCGYSAPRGGEGAPTPYHDANNGYRNHLLENRISGDQWSFEDVTADVGLDENNTRYSLSASWEDFDLDGDPDLYVANDFGRNNLYRNDSGRFSDIAAQAGVEDISAGMGVCWGDFNRDGWPDVYVSNMFSSAGNRVAYQRRFRPGDPETTRAEFQRHARGNSLFQNAGDGTFRDVSVEADVTMGRWAWASLFADLNNDSHLDILVTNGLVTNEDPDDL